MSHGKLVQIAKIINKYVSYWLDVMWVVSELGHITAFRTPSVLP